VFASNLVTEDVLVQGLLFRYNAVLSPLNVFNQDNEHLLVGQDVNQWWELRLT
jgi:hypothetical protein